MTINDSCNLNTSKFVFMCDYVYLISRKTPSKPLDIMLYNIQPRLFRVMLTQVIQQENYKKWWRLLQITLPQDVKRAVLHVITIKMSQ